METWVCTWSWARCWGPEAWRSNSSTLTWKFCTSLSPASVNPGHTYKKTSPHPPLPHTNWLCFVQRCSIPTEYADCCGTLAYPWFKAEIKLVTQLPHAFETDTKSQLNHCEGIPWSEEPYPSGGENDSVTDIEPRMSLTERPVHFPITLLADHATSFKRVIWWCWAEICPARVIGRRSF